MLSRARTAQFVLGAGRRILHSLRVDPSRNVHLNAHQIVRIGSEQEKRQFDSVAPSIIENAKELFEDLSESWDYLVNVLQSTVFSNVHSPGFAVPVLYKMFEEPQKLTAENIQLANILGWCGNMLCSVHQIIEEMAEESGAQGTRLNWHKEEGVGVRAVYDMEIVYQVPYLLLIKHLSQHPAYLPMLEWTRKVSTNVGIGQSIDNICAEESRSCTLSADRFRTLVEHKYLYLLIYPVVSALHLAGKHSERLQCQAKEALEDFAVYIRAQEDVSNYLGNRRRGKVDGSVLSGKCTWLAVKSLELATVKERETLLKHYGCSSEGSAGKVMELYENLKVVERFSDFQLDVMRSVSKKIQQTDGILREPLNKFVNALSPQTIP